MKYKHIKIRIITLVNKLSYVKKINKKTRFDRLFHFNI